MTRQIPVGAVCPYAGQVALCDDAPNEVWQHTAFEPSQVDPDLQMANRANDIEQAGWMLCDGRFLSVDAYPALFAVLGTLYGAGGTPTARTFRIPDYRNLVMRGTEMDSPLGPNGIGASARATYINVNYIIKFR